MSNATKNTAITFLATVCLIGPMASARADDVVTPPVQAPAAPDATPPATTPAEATAPLVAPPLATPPDAVPDQDKWTFTSPLYVWAAGLNGSVTAKGRTANVDASADDIFKHADFGFQGYFQLAKPKFGIYGQPTYIKLSDSASSDHIKGDVTSELWIVEFGAFYRVLDWDGPYHGSISPVLGGRYWHLGNTITIKDPLGKVKGSTNGDIIDPIVGLRWEQYFTAKFHVWVQGDVGGFDLSESQSRFSWQALPLLAYDFTMPVIKKPSTVFAGYRVIGIQHTDGSGANKNAYNMRMNGALIGLNVNLF